MYLTVEWSILLKKLKNVRSCVFLIDYVSSIATIQCEGYIMFNEYKIP